MRSDLSLGRGGSGAPHDSEGSIRSEHELAVTLEIGAGAHVELAVMANKKQRALWHFLGAFQQLARVTGSHLVSVGLAVFVVGVTHVRLELPSRRLLGESRRRQCGKRGYDHQWLDRKSGHVPKSSQMTFQKTRSC